MIKVKFSLSTTIPCYHIYKSTPQDVDDFNMALDEKLDKIVEIPIVPAIGMEVALAAFKEIYDFTEDETSSIDGGDWLMISNILIHPTYIECHLKFPREIN